MTARVETLKAVRDTLLSSLDEAPAAARAPLAREIRATLAEISELEGAAKKAGKAVDPIDELAKRRDARGGATARSRRPAKNSG
jgi:hypothetical protein